MTDILVLPVTEGDRLSEVWLPQSRDLAAMLVRVPATWTPARCALHRAESLGLSSGRVRTVGVCSELGAISVYVCWVPKGGQPMGLQPVSVDEALETFFGPVIRMLQQRLA